MENGENWHILSHVQVKKLALNQKHGIYVPQTCITVTAENLK